MKELPNTIEREIYQNFLNAFPLRNPPKDFKLGVIIDCANMTQDIIIENGCESLNHETWTTTKEQHRNVLSYPFLLNFELKAFIFRAVLKSTEKPENLTISIDVDKELAWKLSESYRVGCLYPGNLLKEQSEDETIAKVCKSINGSLYVLQMHVNLNDADLKNPSYYANVIRKNLEELKLVRLLILKQHPEAMVYFHVQLNTSLGQDQTNTVFCNQVVLQVNEY